MSHLRDWYQWGNENKEEAIDLRNIKDFDMTGWTREWGIKDYLMRAN